MKDETQSKFSGSPRRARYTRAEKAKHLKCWEQSGLSGLEYARQNGLHHNALYSWRSTSMRGHTQSAQAPQVCPDFVSLDVPVGSSMKVTLRLRDMKLTVDSCSNYGEVIELLRAFKKEFVDV